MRLTTVYLFDYKVWVSYLVLGAIFCAGRARSPTPSAASPPAGDG